MTVIPDAILALVDVCAAALPDARVDDGPGVDLLEQDTAGITTGVTVAWQEDGPAVEASLDREMSDGMGADLEVFTIFSTLLKGFGNADPLPLRGLTFADYTAIKAKLRERHPIVPGVLQARMTVVDYEVRPNETGWDARLRFAVEVSAFDRD